MAVRQNIGKLVQALEAGLKAERMLDLGPIDVESPMSKIEYNISENALTPTYPNVFVMGRHKWGSKKKLVG